MHSAVTHVRVVQGFDKRGTRPGLRTSMRAKLKIRNLECMKHIIYIMLCVMYKNCLGIHLGRIGMQNM